VDLDAYAQLEFVGSCAFNVCMAASSVLSVVVYETVSMTAPFYAVAALSGWWAIVVLAYFGVRLRGRTAEESFADSERALLQERLRSARTPTASVSIVEEIVSST
jgi:hypothetical protein